MKMVKAIIRPERLEFVKKALEVEGIFGMTISEVMGRGDQKGISLQYRGGTMTVELIPKIEIDIVVGDTEAGLVIQKIRDAAYTGNCLLYTSPSPRDRTRSRMPSSA